MLGRNLIQSAAGNAAEAETGWDIDDLAFTGNNQRGFFALDDNLRFLRGMAIANSGTKLYVCSAAITGSFNSHITEYTLSTAYDLSTKTKVHSLNVHSQESSIEDVAIKSDGTKMYCIGVSGDEVNEFSLSTAYSLSTASHSHAFDVSSEDANPRALFFKPDGAKMYIAGASNDKIFEYDLSTAWDVSTASYNQSFSYASQTGTVNSIAFKSDGTKMFLGYSDDYWEYDLSTAWDISTASYSASATNWTRPISQFAYSWMKEDGTEMFWCDSNKFCVFSTTITTANDITTLATQPRPTTDFVSLSSDGNTDPNGIFFRDNGEKMYTVDTTGDLVYEYDLSTAWDITTKSKNQTFNFSSLGEYAFGIHFKPDGTSFYFVGLSYDKVYQYDMTTAWDISTASANGSFSVSTQQLNPRYCTFKTDGTKMYVSGASGDELNEYDLSTAWDVTTATFNQVATNTYLEGAPYFKPDGRKLITVKESTAARSNLAEYDLSTAWDISTLGTVNNNNRIFAQTSMTGGLFVKEDGSKLFVADRNLEGVVAFDM